MRVDIAWWDLDGTGQTIESLRAYLERPEAVEPWHTLPGLGLKVWIADPEANRWGAVMLWSGRRPAAELLPPNTPAKLIGSPPGHRFVFRAEATAGQGIAPARRR